MSKTVYALYRGDEYVDMGTAEELAERHGVKPATIRRYGAPSHARRCEQAGRMTTAVKVDVADGGER